MKVLSYCAEVTFFKFSSVKKNERLEWHSVRYIPSPRPLMSQNCHSLFKQIHILPCRVSFWLPLIRNRKPNVTWFWLPPKSDGFFRGPCATFPSNFMQIGRVDLRNPANKQTNANENKTLAELEKPQRRTIWQNWSISLRNCSKGPSSCSVPPVAS